MENAAQALLIAAGMMLAVLLISLILMVRQEMAKPLQAREERKQRDQIESFNKSYLAYDQNLLQGSQVLSVLNRAYDHAISLEPITMETGTSSSKRTRKLGSNVNEPLVNVEVRFKETSEFDMTFRYEAAKFDNTGKFMGKPSDADRIPVYFGGNKISDILGITVNNREIQDFLEKTKLEQTDEVGPKEIKVTFASSQNSIQVFTREPNNKIVITDDIYNFMGLGGNTPSVSKKNNKITKDNNWINVKFTTPAASFIRRSFKWDPNGVEYNSEGYITKIVFEEV